MQKIQKEGADKMSWRERDIAPHPQHVTGILGPIGKYYSTDSWFEKFFKKSEKGGGGGEGGVPRPVTSGTLVRCSTTELQGTRGKLGHLAIYWFKCDTCPAYC